MITATDRRLLQILGDWMQNDGPLYSRLTRAFVSAIEQSDLPPGTKLPAERSLADRNAATTKRMQHDCGRLAPDSPA